MAQGASPPGAEAVPSALAAGDPAPTGRCGARAAAALGLFGEEVDGVRAVALGLAWAAYEDGEVHQRALAIARRVAADPDLARRAVTGFRRETAPGGLPWDIAVELERSPQMWSLRRKHP